MKNSNVLTEIPAMWYGNPSAVCYTGSVMRLMEYIGDPVKQDELFALSGVGLCFPWKFASSCDEVSIIPEIPGRIFEAFGYESEHLTGEAVGDKALCLGRTPDRSGGILPRCRLGEGFSRLQPPRDSGRHGDLHQPIRI